jgi:hypothetical protein
MARITITANILFALLVSGVAANGEDFANGFFSDISP